MIQLIHIVKIETGRAVRSRRNRYAERSSKQQIVTISGTLDQMKNLLNGLQIIATACPFQGANIGLASGACPRTGATVSSKAPIQITPELVRDLGTVLTQLERCQ